MRDLHHILELEQTEKCAILGEIQSHLFGQSAAQRVEWALENLPANHVLSSSFGAQSAVMLHLLTRARPDIPVVLIDTGYLFRETYKFVDELTQRLDLNLKIYRSDLSPAWQEARFGKLWEQGVEGIRRYNDINKVQPMQQAMKELDVATWFSGLRRTQSESRADREFLEIQGSRLKVHPIADWSNRDLHFYMKEHDLPYHPLWDEGYVSIGDVHTTRKLEDGMSEEETRFMGLMRECGLHTNVA